jgi:hypothetical protein
VVFNNSFQKFTMEESQILGVAGSQPACHDRLLHTPLPSSAVPPPPFYLPLTPLVFFSPSLASQAQRGVPIADCRSEGRFASLSGLGR